MAYPNFYNPYPQQMYQQPMQDQLAQLRQGQYQQTQQGNNGIIWVQGESGAKSYMVAPGNTVLLMDSEGSAFYLKSSDGSGMPLPLRIFDYTERTAAPKPASAGPQSPREEYVTQAEFNALAERLEALENKPCKCKKVKEDAENE